MPETVFWCISEVGSFPPGLYASSLLHPAELERFKGMKIPKRREEWLHGRLTAKRLLTAPGQLFFNTPFNHIHIENHIEGAPFIAAPAFPGCNLSISHRDTLATVVYAQEPDIHIGVDLEKIESRAWAFVEDFFTPEEYVYARSLPENEKNLWVTLAWSAKEAILKVWQKGLRLDTRSVEILPTSSELLAAPISDWQPLSWRSHLPEYPDCWLYWQPYGDYIVTMAGEIKKGDSSSEPPNIQKINL